MLAVKHRLAPAVTLRALRPQVYIGIAVVGSAGSIGAAVGRAFHVLYERAGQDGLQVDGLPFLVAGDADADALSVEVGLPVVAAPPASDGIHAGRLPGGRAVVALYQGPYERIAPGYDELRDWMAAHGLEPAGPPREVYLNGPADVTSEEQLLTELVWPVA